MVMSLGMMPWTTANGCQRYWESYGLPSEAEWEKGARGTDGRIYPWGNQWDAMRCNSAESGLGKTTSVHAYPQGASPSGLLDMAGNVWEWTRSLWGKSGKIQTTDIHTGRLTGVRTWRPGERYSVCCGAARSTTAAGTCGVPIARGVVPDRSAGTSAFGWWCTQLLSR